MLNRCEIGDCREVLRKMIADGVKVQMCVTSPPYWGLRDYGVDGQIGLEKTPEEYLATMVEVFRLVREVLADDGSLWLNLGDSYASGGERSTGRNDTDRETPGGRGGSFRGGDRRLTGQRDGLKPKDLIGMPWRVAFALQADAWYLRSDIIWAKSNPMPESVTDRPTKSHEYLFLLTKRSSYFYDAEAVREPHAEPWRGKGEAERNNWSAGGREDSRGSKNTVRLYNPAGRNRRTVWTIATSPFPGAHFATFPPKLVEPCILAGTSEVGHCPVCSARHVRVVEREQADRMAHTRAKHLQSAKSTLSHSKTGHGGWAEFGSKTIDLGFRPTCECGRKPVPDVCLDPFLGSGTVAEVAEHLGRGWIGIDLNPSYAPMQKRRTAQMALALASGE